MHTQAPADNPETTFLTRSLWSSTCKNGGGAGNCKHWGRGCATLILLFLRVFFGVFAKMNHDRSAEWVIEMAYDKIMM